MEQLLAHLVGDYLVQSDWMALNKRRSTWPCFVHCWCYAMCFWPILWSNPHAPRIWCVILATHFLIDRFGLARYVVWTKNWIGPVTRWPRPIPGSSYHLCPNCRRFAGRIWHVAVPPFSACSATGYPPNRDAWLTVWLLIIADNTLHLLCNYAALRWL